MLYYTIRYYTILYDIIPYYLTYDILHYTILHYLGVQKQIAMGAAAKSASDELPAIAWHVCKGLGFGV